jgi:hypothetical protein
LWHDGQNCHGVPTKATNILLSSDPDSPVSDILEYELMMMTMETLLPLH